MGLSQEKSYLPKAHTTDTLLDTARARRVSEGSPSRSGIYG